MYAMFGWAIALRMRCRNVISIGTIVADAVRSVADAAVESRDGAAVELLQQIVEARRHEIDERRRGLRGLLFGERLALKHGLLGQRARCGRACPRCVRTYAAMSSAAFFEVVSSIDGAAAGHRMRGADVRAGRHRRDVGGDRDDEAGRRRPRARRRHVHRNRRLRRDHFRDDVARRIDETAGRAQREHDERRVRGVGARDRVDHVLRGNGMDDAVDFGGVDDGLCARQLRN